MFPTGKVDNHQESTLTHVLQWNLFSNLSSSKSRNHFSPTCVINILENEYKCQFLIGPSDNNDDDDDDDEDDFFRLQFKIFGIDSLAAKNVQMSCSIGLITDSNFNASAVKPVSRFSNADAIFVANKCDFWHTITKKKTVAFQANLFIFPTTPGNFGRLSNFKGTTKTEPISPTFTDDMKNLLNDSSTADVTLVTSDGQEVMAHKVILMARSAHFKAIFSSKIEMVESKTNRIELDNISAPVLAEILFFIYTGTCSPELKSSVSANRPSEFDLEDYDLENCDLEEKKRPAKRAKYEPKEEKKPAKPRRNFSVEDVSSESDEEIEKDNKIRKTGTKKEKQETKEIETSKVEQKTGENKIESLLVIQVSAASKFLLLDSLADICTMLLIKCLDTKNVGEFLIHANLHQDALLKNQCIKFITKESSRLGQLMSSQSFQNMDKSLVADILATFAIDSDSFVDKVADKIIDKVGDKKKKRKL